MLGKPQPDKEIMKKETYRALFEASSKEAFRQGINGPLHEIKLYCNDWGFNLEDINMEVMLWHGVLDKSTPFWMGKYLASHLKKCKATFWSNNGHFLIASRGEEILANL